MLTIEKLDEIAAAIEVVRECNRTGGSLAPMMPRFKQAYEGAQSMLWTDSDELIALAREALANRAAESAHSEFNQKLRALCNARHPYLNKHFGGPGMTEQDEAELAEIERQIDEMQMAEIGNIKSALEMKLDAVKSTVAYKVGKLKLENDSLRAALEEYAQWAVTYTTDDDLAFRMGSSHATSTISGCRRTAEVNAERINKQLPPGRKPVKIYPCNPAAKALAEIEKPQ